MKNNNNNNKNQEFDMSIMFQKKKEGKKERKSFSEFIHSFFGFIYLQISIFFIDQFNLQFLLRFSPILDFKKFVQNQPKIISLMMMDYYYFIFILKINKQ